MDNDPNVMMCENQGGIYLQSYNELLSRRNADSLDPANGWPTGQDPETLEYAEAVSRYWFEVAIQGRISHSTLSQHCVELQGKIRRLEQELSSERLKLQIARGDE